ncbi:hypothetical protein LAZ67_13000573 [Cordylochernes scorpioides]|uniref:POU-specific domain-containing protein n=1 Tax=Cordylochernes scorpioides TaxID=51811 RepID=A0ABY6L710_9ARAC|nr:hypothetical protein LAZ67_13000573 [Cordylochernes scorpioides]
MLQAGGCTETINNTEANVVDGINLEEIKDFAKAFKLRRLSLGLTQTQVGQALSATEGPSYSQSAICRPLFIVDVYPPFVKLPVEIHHQLVEVYGEKCIDIKNVRKWCREFNEGQINVHDEQQSGRPSLPESTVARIDEMVCANRRITLEEIEDGLNEDCSHFSVHKIVSETLGYRKVSARWVDKWLKEAAGEWYNTGITKLVDRMKKVIEHQGGILQYPLRKKRRMSENNEGRINTREEFTAQLKFEEKENIQLQAEKKFKTRAQGNQLLSQNFNISEAWTNSWISSDIPNKNLVTSPSVKIPGFSLPRREWVLLNRFRTGQGRCAELMKLWGYTKDPNCACNVPQSMSHILDDCPLYKFNGGISNLHSVTPEALNWLKALPLRL